MKKSLKFEVGRVGDKGLRFWPKKIRGVWL